MYKYLLNKLTQMVLIVFIVSSITFFVVRLFPGDPVHLWVGGHPTEEQIERATKELGLNKPMYIQYISFLKNLVLFDLGVSIRTKQPVTLELANRFSATFELVFFSMILAFIIGFPLGLLAALKSNTLLDTFIRGIGYIGLAIPIFWLGMMMQLLFFGTLQWLSLIHI